MTTLTIRIDANLKTKAEAAASANNTNLSAVIRNALADYINTIPHPLDGSDEEIPAEALSEIRKQTMVMGPNEKVTSSIMDVLGL